MLVQCWRQISQCQCLSKGFTTSWSKTPHTKEMCLECNGTTSIRISRTATADFDGAFNEQGLNARLKRKERQKKQNLAARKLQYQIPHDSERCFLICCKCFRRLPRLQTDMVRCSRSSRVSLESYICRLKRKQQSWSVFQWSTQADAKVVWCQKATQSNLVTLT